VIRGDSVAQVTRDGRSHAQGVALFLLAATAALSACSGGGGAPRTTAGPGSVPPPGARTLASDAYVWGSPLVVSMRTVQTFARLIGVNRLYPQQQLTDPQTRLIVAPNVDTLYSVAVLDLRDGPVVLSVPEIHDRYYTYQFLDMYTESFAYVGTRATGGVAGSWVIAAPGWSGTGPTGAQVIHASTPLVFLLGRFLVSGASDLPAARGVMARVRLEPLVPHAQASAPSGSALGEPPGTPQNVAAAGPSFFDELGDALAVNPPSSPADRAALARFQAIGVGPVHHPAGAATPSGRATLAQGVTDGAARVEGADASSVHEVNGWETRRQLGHYGDDFLLRAVVARSVWGANVPDEAVYLRSQRDARGGPYSGTHAYALHFAAGELPPAAAFWSLTVYGPDMFLVENPAGRYAIGDRTPALRTNSDGSLDLYLQHSAPPGHETNWLPVPAGGFTLIMRIYLPERTVLDGTYRLPAVQPAA